MKHRSGIAGGGQQTAHLDFNATTSTHSGRLNMHTFIFSSFKQQQWMIVLSLNCRETIQARRIVHTHPCVYFKCIYTYAQIVFWLTFASWFMSPFLIQECMGQPVQNISHKVCTTIYIIYIRTLRKPAQTPASDRQLQRQAYLEKDKKLFWHFSP